MSIYVLVVSVHFANIQWNPFRSLVILIDVTACLDSLGNFCVLAVYSERVGEDQLRKVFLLVIYLKDIRIHTK